MIRVAFLLGALDQGWLGGINYYRGLIYALSSLPDRRIQPVIVTGSQPSAALIEALENRRQRLREIPGRRPRRDVHPVFERVVDQ